MLFCRLPAHRLLDGSFPAGAGEGDQWNLRIFDARNGRETFSYVYTG